MPLSDSDFQAVLRSFAEFTGQQFNNPLLNLREIQGNRHVFYCYIAVLNYFLIFL